MSATKHHLTCPFELISGGSLIGMEGILMILGNYLVRCVGKTLRTTLCTFWSAAFIIVLLLYKTSNDWVNKRLVVGSSLTGIIIVRQRTFAFH